MFIREKFQHIILAALGAIVFSTASVGAAVGPAAIQGPASGGAVQVQA